MTRSATDGSSEVVGVGSSCSMNVMIVFLPEMPLRGPVAEQSGRESPAAPPADQPPGRRNQARLRRRRVPPGVVDLIRRSAAESRLASRPSGPTRAERAIPRRARASPARQRTGRRGVRAGVARRKAAYAHRLEYHRPNQAGALDQIPRQFARARHRHVPTDDDQTATSRFDDGRDHGGNRVHRATHGQLLSEARPHARANQGRKEINSLGVESAPRSRARTHPGHCPRPRFLPHNS